MKTQLKYLPLFTLAIISLTFLFRSKIKSYFFAPRENFTQPGVNLNSLPSNAPQTANIETIAENLSIPWEIAFLPDGNMLATERAGKLLKIGSVSKTIQEIQGVKHIGEGGLLGLAIHPNFSQNNYIYLYLTTQGTGGITNRVERYKLTSDALSDKTILLTGIKGSANHDGGRLAFGPDRYPSIFYITLQLLQHCLATKLKFRFEAPSWQYSSNRQLSASIQPRH
jgi:glucose/arabinose dehydrogenase